MKQNHARDKIYLNTLWNYLTTLIFNHSSYRHQLPPLSSRLDPIISRNIEGPLERRPWKAFLQVQIYPKFLLPLYPHFSLFLYNAGCFCFPCLESEEFGYFYYFWSIFSGENLLVWLLNSPSLNHYSSTFSNIITTKITRVFYFVSRKNKKFKMRIKIW